MNTVITPLIAAADIQKIFLAYQVRAIIWERPLVKDFALQIKFYMTTAFNRLEISI